MSAAHSSASSVRRHPSSSLMVSLQPSPSVLILGHPHRALSRFHFISPCPSLAPLPLPCIGARLTRPWCPRAHHSGRCPSSSSMVPLSSSSTVGFCNRHAPAWVDHQRLGVRLGRHHMQHVQLARSSACAHRASPLLVLSRPPHSAGYGTCAYSCSGPTVWSGPSSWEIYLVLSISPFLLTVAANSLQ
jgi:hypothetical protein